MRDGFKTPAVIFIIVLIVYGVISYKELLHGQSPSPHYVYQAQSFLHGKLHLEQPVIEVANWDGRQYVFQAPFPSILMLPFVAIFGGGMNDVLFTILFGAFNPSLLYLILKKYQKKGHLVLSDGEILWMVSFFAFGTIHFYMSLRGLVWYTAQIVATTMTLFYLYFTSDLQKSFQGGIFSGLAFAARPTLILGTLLYSMISLIGMRGFKTTLKNLGLFFLGFAMVGSCVAVFNYFRFQDPFEFGYKHTGVALTAANIKHTFYLTYLKLPIFRKDFPYLWFDGWGLSFFIVMPGFLSLLFIRRWVGRMTPFLVTILSIAFLLLGWPSPGFYSFGPRYTLDFIPYLVLFLSMGLPRLNFMTKCLIVLSICYNTYGAMIFPYEVWPETFKRTLLYDLFFR